jgi:hypothetical protein
MRYELKARTLSEILDGTFKLYSDNAAAFLTISAIASIPVMAFQIFAGWSKSLIAGGATGTILAVVGGMLVMVPMVFLAIIVQYCALAFAAADAYQGRSFTPGEAFSRTFGMLGSLLWVSILFGAAFILGLMFFIIPGIYLSLIWAVWLQAMVVEGKRGGAALGRSRDLTKGSLGRIGGILLIFFAVQLALMFGISAAIPAVLQGIPFLGTALQQLSSVLIAPLYPALLTLVYFDGRIRHEGYDLEMKASEDLAGASAAAAFP